jgi:NitT/TauT family transport system ATP-binding protein
LIEQRLGSSRAHAIELRGVTKIYTQESGEEVHGVTDVDLSIGPGEFVCFLGPSGHGKTTLLNLIAGFIMPTRGEVLVHDKRVEGPGPDRGVVFQQDTLFLWKRVADNIAFGPRARGVPKRQRQAIVEKYLRLIDLERFGRAWPKELSGGMRRRVAIAAVFANDPEVLLMDEPFVGLDYVRRAALHRVLLDLWEASRRTVFFVTHDVDEALALGDRIVVITDGRIVLDRPVPFGRPRSPAVLGSEAASEIRLAILEQMGLGRSPGDVI